MPSAVSDSSAPAPKAIESNGGSGGEGGDKVQMKKQLGLIEGTAIILGIIFGSGRRQFPFFCRMFKFICGMQILNFTISTMNLSCR